MLKLRIEFKNGSIQRFKVDKVLVKMDCLILVNGNIGKQYKLSDIYNFIF
jgi:hypothetical protein